MSEVRADPMEALRRRSSVKWRLHPDDVIPMFVAEMDYPLFPAIAETLIAHIRASDTGYINGPTRVAEAFAGFADRHWAWKVDPDLVQTTTDVSVAVVESLRMAIRPGDGVVITPPVYPPFFDLVTEAGGVVVEVPLVREGDARSAPQWSLDIDGIDRALSAGARAVLLCSPHNPLGLVHPPEVLAALAESAAHHGATVVSDEIHAPLTHTDARFTPFLSVSDAAREIGIATPSASKAFGLAGVKCALITAASERGRALIAGLPEEVGFRTSILGAAATAVGYSQGDGWLAATVDAIVASRELLAELLAAKLPDAVLHLPHASFIAWIDLTAYGWSDDPAAVLLDKARVALGNGPTFGRQGRGFARINYACSPETLTEAIDRIAAIV